MFLSQLLYLFNRILSYSKNDVNPPSKNSFVKYTPVILLVIDDNAVIGKLYINIFGDIFFMLH